jgi:hypothetical protein
MLIFSNFPKLFEGTSVLFAERRGAQIRADSIKHYGITPEVISGDESYLVFRITPPSDRGLLYQFFQFIHAEAVTVEVDDVPRFVTDKVIRTGLVQNWGAVSGSLDKLTPDEVFDALERAALMVFSARPEQGTSTDEQWLRGEQTKQSLEAMRQAGIADPLAKWNAIDAQRQREKAEVQAREDRAVDGFMAEQELPQEPIYSHSGFLVNPQEEEF